MGLLVRVAALALFVCGPARGAVTVSRIDYHGWKGAYRLTNGTVELVVVPQIGRIMRYGTVGGPNVLWNNPALYGKTIAPAHAPKDWTNFGGDKLWPAPQAVWGWPPDPDIDPGRHTAVVLKGNRLRLTGGPSKKHNIRFVREIVLDATGTGVTIRNTMENVSDETVNWSVWEVAQANDPDSVALALNRKGKFKDGYYTFKDNVPPAGRLRITDGQLQLHRDSKKSYKVGVDSPTGRIAIQKRGVQFTISAAYEPGGNYPDEGCAQEVYSNPDPLPYMEMELLGPIRPLAPTEKTTFVTMWRLDKLPR